MIPLVVLGVVVALLVVEVAVSYTRLVGQRKLVADSWRQIVSELQRRDELISNLVTIVQGHVAHEREVVEHLSAARSAAQAQAESGPGARQQPERQLGLAVRGLLALADSYPDLKASAGFLAVQQQLQNTEDRIAADGQFYNGNVRSYNTRIKSVPSSIIASVCRFTPVEHLEIEAGSGQQVAKT
ncbi:MAG: LemA family protein [Nocardioidaceae bacterium]